MADVYPNQRLGMYRTGSLNHEPANGTTARLVLDRLTGTKSWVCFLVQVISKYACSQMNWSSTGVEERGVGRPLACFTFTDYCYVFATFV